jgi:hypothetical protein
VLTAGQQRWLERPARARAALLMERWEGWKEQPPDSNVCPPLAKVAAQIGLSDWYQGMGWSWCAFAVHVAAAHQGCKAAKAGLEGAYNALYTVAILEEARQAHYGLRLLAGTKGVTLGDWAEFDFPGGDEVDHIGFVLAGPGRRWHARDGRVLGGRPDAIVTVEGNTSSGDGGSQSNGGMVAVRERDLSLVRAFVRAY